MWGCFLLRRQMRALGLVFPMHVGVFLSQATITRAKAGLPHACGGVSDAQPLDYWHLASSPCMWGCFLRHSMRYNTLLVFPMHVGVFLKGVDAYLQNISLPHACGGVSDPGSTVRAQRGLPHACGGVSPVSAVFCYDSGSSPCMWGCFFCQANGFPGEDVFPMHVGVFLLIPLLGVKLSSLPHACGGVSYRRCHYSLFRLSSPCMWGCFHGHPLCRCHRPVFPMHVGVFLTSCVGLSPPESLPHARMET